MDISRALAIDGWMEPTELRWLAEQASTHKRIAEIGSWKGRSTRAMADNLAEGGRIVAIDTWKGSDEEPHRAELRAHTEGWLLEEFERNMEGTLSSKVKPLQMLSLDAAYALRNERFDMIFLDASHDYENVRADILAWLPLLENGGLFCGHDYDVFSTYDGRVVHCGVTRAVDEFFPKHRNHKPSMNSIWSAE